MTTLETAKALGVQIRTVRKYMYDGELAYTKIGNRCDISAEEVTRFKADKADRAEEKREREERARTRRNRQTEEERRGLEPQKPISKRTALKKTAKCTANGVI